MANTMSFPSAGHNSTDPGAIAANQREADIMNGFRHKVVAAFEKRKHSYITDYHSESNREYQGRIKPRAGDVIVDFHLNASSNPKATGVEVIISNNAGKDSKALAKELVDGLAEIMQITNRGVKTEAQTARGTIGILNHPGTAALIEFCFISNPADLKSFKDNEDRIATFVTDKIIKYDRNK